MAHLEPCVYERYPGAAMRPLPPGYRPRRPQQSVLHRIVREHLETFLAEGRERSESGEGYPYYVEKELRDYLSCADLSRGFARLRCGTCGHELLLPFSCKRRGICPSCTTRRMSDEAAWLVDALLPEAPYRQWTLTFPFALRFMMARDHRLITAIFGIAMRILFAWQRRQARRAGHPGAKTAAVLAVQRFGGALNLNVHGHALLPDGVFVLEEGRYRFVPLAPPEEPDLCAMTARVARRVTAFLERRYLTLEEGATDLMGGAISEAMSRPSLPLWAQAAQDEPAEAASPPRPRRCASVDGFSIHAGTAVTATNRIGLEKLCRYGLRPAFSHERLALAPGGQVVLGLRKPWPTASGANELRLEPLAFLRRLASLTPPPYAHLLRYYGLLAPHAKGRDLLPPAPPSPLGLRAESALRAKLSHQSREGQVSSPCDPSEADHASSASAITSLPPTLAAPCPDPAELQDGAWPAAQVAAPRPARKALPWHELLRRVFAFDVLICPRCAGPMMVLAYLTERAVLEKILTHLGLPQSPPPLSPARRPEQAELCESWDVERFAGWSSRDGLRSSGEIRGPPPEERGDLPEHDDAAEPNERAVDRATDWGS